MNFNEKIYNLVERIDKLKDSINTEEATKTSLIMPFFQLLGYDVFNPLEFVPEFTADVGVKKGEKVDYAIILDGKPTILIECKPCHDNLDKHASQLFRYFTVTPACFGILTNGTIYKFYTDLEKKNIMDKKPFLTVNLENLKERDIVELEKFSKESLDVENILNSAEDLKYSRLIKEWFASELESPSLEFVKFILGNVYDGIKTPKIVDSFTPLIKKSIQQYINDSMNTKIKVALSKESEAENAESLETPSEPSDLADKTSEPKNKIVTTIEELESYAIVKSVLRQTVASDRITYRDTESYFGILLDDNNRKWICRIYLLSSVKYITVADENKNPIRHDIETLDDIYKFSEEIIKACNHYL